jgi:hypothetical protein
LETNQGVGKGKKLKCILEQWFSNIFSNVPLSQYKTYTCTTVTIQNMFMVHYHNTKYVCVPLGTANINGYIQDTVLPGCFIVRLKYQCCGNIKFCSCYFCNLKRLDDGVCIYIGTMNKYLGVHFIHVFLYISALQF